VDIDGAFISSYLVKHDVSKLVELYGIPIGEITCFIKTPIADYIKECNVRYNTRKCDLQLLDYGIKKENLLKK